MIGVVILKPTRDCNADCSYCSSPPDGNGKWSIEKFKNIYDRIYPGLSDRAVLIWHGGEPMLMGPEFYRQAYEYVRSKEKNVTFSIQSNLLLYKSSIWKDVFKNIFKGSISTSFEPDNSARTVKGNAEKYTKQFNKKIIEVVNDGFFPLVIGTYSKKTSNLSFEMYDRSINSVVNSDGKKSGFDIRVNYMYPIGRSTNEGEGISPYDYGLLLIEHYNKRIKDAPDIDIVPLSEMLRRTINVELVNKCPWTNKCGGHFLAIEPNGDCYNCSEFADLDNKDYAFGNVIDLKLYDNQKIIFGDNSIQVNNENFIELLMKTKAARRHKRREVDMPSDCFTCEHFNECKGGCHRDAVLFERGMGGKFYYCESWKMVFKRIKESVLNGEADELINKRGWSLEESKDHVRKNHNIIMRF